jgi:hypothetical protein
MLGMIRHRLWCVLLTMAEGLTPWDILLLVNGAAWAVFVFVVCRVWG